MTQQASHEENRNAVPAAEASPSGYTLWAVFRRGSTPVGGESAALTAQLDAAVETVTAAGTVVRGFYDVSGLRSDADLMVWLHGDTADQLQEALRVLRRTDAVAGLEPTWNAMGVHRDAEFNRSHVPGFLRGKDPKGWLCLYPFVRSYEWYLLPEEDRKRMLADHGRKGAAHRGVLANTVASFALGDYEWLLPLEADDPAELVDVMRDLRYTEARMHVREEVPFFTGRRIGTDEVPEVIR